MSDVLVVDDEAAMRQLMTRWVELAGHRAFPASNAEEALAIMVAQPQAIALCDIRMPGHDGLWLAERIRRDFPDTAVIIATGARDTDPRVAEHTGAVDYLLKPFGQDRLKFALERGFDWHLAAADRREWLGRLTIELCQRRNTLTETVAGVDETGASQIEALLDFIGAADPEALCHARRVAAMSVQIAVALGLTGDALNAVRAGALLHDFGKLALPDAILRKPAELSLVEMDIVRQHPGIGARVLQSLAGLEDVAAVVISAREWYDGSGYPGALQGEAIPLGGRVVAAADAFDAMTHAQIYRDAMQSSEALREVLRCSGSQFDPTVVDALLKSLGDSAAQQ